MEQAIDMAMANFVTKGFFSFRLIFERLYRIFKNMWTKLIVGQKIKKTIDINWSKEIIEVSLK